MFKSLLCSLFSTQFSSILRWPDVGRYIKSVFLSHCCFCCHWANLLLLLLLFSAPPPLPSFFFPFLLCECSSSTSSSTLNLSYFSHTLIKSQKFLKRSLHKDVFLKVSTSAAGADATFPISQ